MLLVALLGVCAAGGALTTGSVGRWLTRMAGFLGVAHVALTVPSRRLWESTVRRAAYVASHAQGVDVDRAVDAALAAALMAAAVGCWTLAVVEVAPGDRGGSRRTVCGCTAVLAAVAVAWSALGGYSVR